MTNLVDQVLGSGPKPSAARGLPRHELRVEDDGYRALVELPGMRRQEIEVSIAGRVLSVSGRRTRFEPPPGARLLRRERPSGRIALTVQLPAEVDALAVTARMHDGVLEVRLPRPSSRGRSIEVEAEEASRERPAARPPDEPLPWEEPPHTERWRPEPRAPERPPPGEPPPAHKPFGAPGSPEPLAGEDEPSIRWPWEETSEPETRSERDEGAPSDD